MKKIMRSNTVLLRALIGFSFLLLFTLHGPSFALQTGDPFPKFSAENTLSREELAALGITAGPELSLNALTREIMIIEFLNVYCHTCRMQVAVFNDLYTTLARDPVLAKKVGFLGIAVGNSPDEIAEFRKTFGALYPILADPQKAIFNVTGNVRGTPQTYILSGGEERFIIAYHPGAAASKDIYLRPIQAALRGELTGIEPGNKAPAYSFTYNNRTYDQAYFAGKKVLICFPAKKGYQLASDTRNPRVQLETLSQMAAEFPDVYYVVFYRTQFPQELIKKLERPTVFMPEKADKVLIDRFAVTAEPSIYYINQYGRISFGGPCITLLNAREIFKGKDYKIAPSVSSEEVIRLIENDIKQSGEKVLRTEKATLEDGEDLYVTALAPQDRDAFLYARVVSKLSVCDVCHDSHFIYLFDQEGRIKSFIPIALTKYGNLPWTAPDVVKINKSIVGKSMFQPFPFNPKVDAVSSATMTSSLIYEALGQAKNSMTNCKDHQFRKEHWKDLCFENICLIKKTLGEMKQAGTSPVVNGTEPDYTAMEKFLPGVKSRKCPLSGTYLVTEGDILCSVHGLNLGGCKK